MAGGQSSCRAATNGGLQLSVAQKRQDLGFPPLRQSNLRWSEKWTRKLGVVSGSRIASEQGCSARLVRQKRLQLTIRSITSRIDQDTEIQQKSHSLPAAHEIPTSRNRRNSPPARPQRSRAANSKCFRTNPGPEASIVTHPG